MGPPGSEDGPRSWAVLSLWPTLLPTQASVYCVAAVLWTAAKFSVPQDRKLALPRRLKTLLLHMARRSAQERPSAAEAIEVPALWGAGQALVSGGGQGWTGSTWVHLWMGGQGPLLLISQPSPSLSRSPVHPPAGWKRVAWAEHGPHMPNFPILPHGSARLGVAPRSVASQLTTARTAGDSESQPSTQALPTKGCCGVLLPRSPQASGCHPTLRPASPQECTARPCVWMLGCACFQTCSGYLLQRGMDSRKILAHLRALTCQVSWARQTPQTLCATPGRRERLPLFLLKEEETPGQSSRSLPIRWPDCAAVGGPGPRPGLC